MLMIRISGNDVVNLVSFNGHLAPVVRRVDSAIHWIIQFILLVFIRLIVIYMVDSVIHLLNDRGLIHDCQLTN